MRHRFDPSRTIQRMFGRFHTRSGCVLVRIGNIFVTCRSVRGRHLHRLCQRTVSLGTFLKTLAELDRMFRHSFVVRDQKVFFGFSHSVAPFSNLLSSATSDLAEIKVRPRNFRLLANGPRFPRGLLPPTFLPLTSSPRDRKPRNFPGIVSSDCFLPSAAWRLQRVLR